MAKTLIIAAVSTRAYVQAAVACGYEVIALDAFIDAEAKVISKQTFKLKFDGFVLDETYFKQVFKTINLSGVEGFLYGSLFDSCPNVLDWVAKQLPVLGNTADVLKQAKDFSFFGLLDSLNIAHPEVRLNLPSQPEHWLSKQIGGSGGMHIQSVLNLKNTSESDKTYFQKKMAGIPISMLFVADGNTAHLIGFNQQLIAPISSSKNLPYRFAGAVSNVRLQPNIRKQFEQAAQKLTRALHLRGICSLDAIVENGNVWVLELNPRLSATFHLYENLLPLHLHGCLGQGLPSDMLEGLLNYSTKINASNTHLILYADAALDIPQHFAWPDWAVDIPCVESGDSDIKTSVKTNVKISQHMPICSVLAQAESAEVAQNLVQKRAKELRGLLK